MLLGEHLIYRLQKSRKHKNNFSISYSSHQSAVFEVIDFQGAALADMT